jgi:hypothetical protein
MEAIGWEITPVGWIAIIILIALIAHYIIVWLRNPADQNQ